MEFKPLKLDRLIEITDIITVHYFEYDSAFVFSGESHPFWEFLFVDSGCVEVTAGNKIFHLSANDIIFHQPNEFHALKAGKPAPNLVVISFFSASASMDFFREKHIQIDADEKKLLASIITEAKKAFADPLDNPSQKEIRLKEHASPASCQTIALYLENFLLHLMRRFEPNVFSPPECFASPPTHTADEQLLEQIQSYLLSHLTQNLSLEKIAESHLISVSHLEKLIRKYHGCGVCHYFISLKITRAQQLIRERNLNFSQISNSLGYSSVHYFSRQFKKMTGMSPSEYSESVKKDTSL